MINTSIKEETINGSRVAKTYANINDLKPNPQNPRDIEEEKLADLKDFLSKYPSMKPLLVDVRPENEGEIIGGNMRLRAYKELGVSEVWVELRDPITNAQAFEMGTIDNMEFGHYVESKLMAVLKQYDGEIDFTKLGVHLGKIPTFDEMLKQFKKDTQEDEPPGVTDTAVSKPGEIYQVGRHRLMCGDATKPEDVEKLMDGQKADMVFTDPPYAVNYGADQDLLNKKSGNKSKLIARPIIGDNLTTEECAEQIWKPAFRNLYESSKDDCSFYLTMCQGGDQMMMMMMMMMSEKWQIKHELIWVKSSPVFSMGRLDYDYQHEPILFGWKLKHNFYGKGKFVKSIWEIPKPSKSDLHPTMKPIELIANAINNSSKQDDIVLDLFGGSGSTLIACEQTDRTCYMIELDPRYVDVIRKRYAKFIERENEWEALTPVINYVEQNTEASTVPEVPNEPEQPTA